MATEETESNRPRAGRSKREPVVETPAQGVAAPRRRNSISAGVEQAENAGTGHSRSAADRSAATSGSAENRPPQSNAWDRLKRVFQRDDSARQATEYRSAGDPAPGSSSA